MSQLNIFALRQFSKLAKRLGLRRRIESAIYDNYRKIQQDTRNPKGLNWVLWSVLLLIFAFKTSEVYLSVQHWSLDCSGLQKWGGLSYLACIQVRLKGEVF